MAINLAATTDIRLVLLSIAVSIVGSYTALDIAAQIMLSEGQTRRWWLLGGGLALGISIWTMHFTAILSHRMTIPVSYDFRVVLLSMGVATIGAIFGLWAVTRQMAISGSLWGGGLLVGSSIVAMHYAAMSSLRLAAVQRYEWLPVVLSCVVAIAASLIALKLSFRPDRQPMFPQRRLIGSALLMGAAISGMHYVAMSGVRFEFAPLAIPQSALIDGTKLAATIGIAVLLILMLALLASFFGRRLSAELAHVAALHQSEERLAQLVEQRTQELQQEKLISEAANQAKSAFLANMSHELRTPLTSIIGFSSVMIQEAFGPINDRQREYLQHISSGGYQLLSLINDLLDLSKIEADREELVLETVTVEEICETCLSIVREQATRRQLDLFLTVSPDASTCAADKRRLTQILLNLLSNAIKFTDSGSVTLAVDQTDTTIQFLVTDTGIGISEAEQSNLFQPFQQLDNGLDRRYEGTGLGLALSQRLAQLHGGKIAVKSAPGQGSCFTLSLPWARAA
ncbi:MAG: hypothetical protein LH660_21865 [Phormidesmis sp. CAN_BIN36]|nr:hypothetical protein [Phormidesmis sp. CAN_BIN36]